jgi:diguanylate cyclase (GGDEF)-like protein
VSGRRPDPAAGGEPAILLVDPRPGAAEALRRSLRAGGFAARVDHAASLAAGLAELAGRPYALVLLALATGDAGGLDGLERIHAIDPEVPVVTASETDDAGLALSALQRGAQDCVLAEDLAGAAAARILRHAIERQRIMGELQQARQREQYLATHDALTGVPNRTLFYDRLTQAIAGARRYHTTLAILYADLDGFKPINDTLGHEAGDRLLQAVAERIGVIVRKSDTVARVGGDEFTVILSQVAKPGDAATVAENMLRRIAQPVRLDGGERRVTASVGIAIYPGDGELADTLVRAADTAMYHAKKLGGDRYAFFERRMRHGN